MSGKKVYLGDGVYAEEEDGMAKIWTERENGIHYIYFEPEVMRSLSRFCEEIWQIPRNDEIDQTKKL